MNKINVGLLFGGISEEYQVSLMSAASVYGAIDKDKYNLHLIGITKTGVWCPFEGDSETIMSESWVIEPEDPRAVFCGDVLTILKEKVDIIFPVLHGPYGEDGSVQGFFEVMKIPYVGADVISSALCMDKIQAKRILMTAGIPVVDYVALYRYNFQPLKDQIIAEIQGKFDYPVFIKPANLGSSVGISKATDTKSLVEGIEAAFKFDEKVVVEQGIDCREVECAVMGNGIPKASGLGEILPSHDFYDYEAKYFDDGKSKMVVPADVSCETVETIRDMAIRAYSVLGCKGLSRIDFFIDKVSGDIILNEVNTMPGFTAYSMYPVLWQEQGLGYSALIDTLIQYGFDRK